MGVIEASSHYLRYDGDVWKEEKPPRNSNPARKRRKIKHAKMEAEPKAETALERLKAKGVIVEKKAIDSPAPTVFMCTQ